MSEVDGVQNSNYISRMRAARSRPAVSKIQLVQLRAKIGDKAIFAFEGDDDKIVFGNWIRRIDGNLTYEAFVCKGKKGVRELKSIVARDTSDLSSNIYYFVDRDFDDLLGFVDTENVFMTETYSVENVLVCETVLDSLLADTFPCHGLPDLRIAITEAFKRDYEEFLQITKSINKRLFCAKRIPISQTNSLPETLTTIISLEIENITSLQPDPTRIVRLSREPTVDEHDKHTEDFDLLDPHSRHRGKFALKFFEDWLRRLTAAYTQGSTRFFADCEKLSKVRSSEHTIGSFAARSPLPVGLGSFIASIAA